MADTNALPAAIIAAVSAISVATIGLRGRAGASRAREDALKEAEIYAKLPSGSPAAKEFSDLLESRGKAWNSQASATNSATRVSQGGVKSGVTLALIVLGVAVAVFYVTLVITYSATN